MSEQDQDAIVGRLIRERGEAARLKAALDAELEQVLLITGKVFRELHVLAPDAVGAKLEPIKKYFNADAFVELLRERGDAHRNLTAKIKTLRDLGVSD